MRGASSRRSWLGPCGLRACVERGFRRRGGGSHRRCGDRRIAETRWWQNRRTLIAAAALLHFNFRKEHRGRGRRNGDAARFGAADAVENVLFVASEENLRERKQRRANDVHAADKFVGTAVRVNAINHHGQNLKRLRGGAAGEREAALNIVEIKAVGLTLVLNFFDEFGTQLSIG